MFSNITTIFSLTQINKHQIGLKERNMNVIMVITLR
jgi:hypothetical protein